MNGKGDTPRNCFSREFKSNYDHINWGKTKQCFKELKQQEKTRQKRIRKANADKIITDPECEYCGKIYCDCPNKY